MKKKPIDIFEIPLYFCLYSRLGVGDSQECRAQRKREREREVAYSRHTKKMAPIFFLPPLFSHFFFALFVMLKSKREPLLMRRKKKSWQHKSAASHMCCIKNIFDLSLAFIFQDKWAFLRAREREICSFPPLLSPSSLSLKAW